MKEMNALASLTFKLSTSTIFFKKETDFYLLTLCDSTSDVVAVSGFAGHFIHLMVTNPQASVGHLFTLLSGPYEKGESESEAVATVAHVLAFLSERKILTLSGTLEASESYPLSVEGRFKSKVQSLDQDGIDGHPQDDILVSASSGGTCYY